MYTWSVNFSEHSTQRHIWQLGWVDGWCGVDWVQILSQALEAAKSLNKGETDELLVRGIP